MSKKKNWGLNLILNAEIFLPSLLDYFDFVIGFELFIFVIYANVYRINIFQIGV